MEDDVTTFCVYNVIHQFQIPLRMEFHFPLYNSNWMFCSAVGVNFVNVFESIGYAISKKDFFPNSSVSNIFTVSIQKENENEIPILNGEVSRPKEMTRKIEADIFLNLGVYYRLPYNDLIRFQLLVQRPYDRKIHLFRLTIRERHHQLPPQLHRSGTGLHPLFQDQSPKSCRKG